MQTFGHSNTSRKASDEHRTIARLQFFRYNVNILYINGGGYRVGVEKDTPVFDRDSMLARMGGDEEFVKEVIGIFLLDAPRQIDSLKASIEKKDLEGLRAHAHTLKGASANVDALTMRAICLKLESDARRGTSDDAEALMECLVNEFEKFRKLV